MPEWLKNMLGLLKGKDVEKLADDDVKAIEKLVDDYIKSLSNPEQKEQKPNIDDILKKLQQPANNDVNALLLQKIEAAMKLFDDEKKAREQMQLQLQEQAKKEKDAKIQEQIKKAIEAGKIPANNEDEKKAWQKRFETDFDDALKILEKVSGITPKNETGEKGKPTLPKTGTRAELMQAAKEAFTTN